jgi:peptidoglycan hydrolase-like protein with peptidoglycan-binding domain
MHVLRLLKYSIIIAIASSAITIAGRSVSGKWAVLDAHLGDSSMDSDSQRKSSNELLQSSREPISIGNDIGANASHLQAKEIQMLLVRCGFLPENQIDGLSGKTTLNATKAFQSSRGLVVDGVFGKKTTKSAHDCNPRVLSENS